MQMTGHAGSAPLSSNYHEKQFSDSHAVTLNDLNNICHACGSERQWKLKQGRKFARAVARSDLNIETRALRREREAQAALLRRAAFIAKQARCSPRDWRRICCWCWVPTQRGLGRLNAY